MPYLTPDDQETLKANKRGVSTPGDLNYLITLQMIRAFSTHPKYEMLHVLYRDFVQEPKKNDYMKLLETELAGMFTIGDIRSAAGLAFMEFYRRVGTFYEDRKIQLNGDLPEYVELLKLLAANVSASVVTPEEEEKKLDEELSK